MAEADDDYEGSEAAVDDKPLLPYAISNVVVQRLDRRAFWMVFTSWLCLMGIGGLIALAGYVFLNAQEVTTADLGKKAVETASSYETQYSSMQSQSGIISAEQQALFAKVHNLLYNLLATSGLTPYLGRQDVIPVSCCDASVNQAWSFDEIANAIEKAEATTSPDSDGTIAIAVSPGYGVNLTGVLQRQSWSQLLIKLRTAPFPLSPQEVASAKTDGLRLNTLANQMNDLQPLVIALRNQAVDARVRQTLGDNGEINANQSKLDALRLIQTTVTRFGTLAIISFVISILAGLYRYLIRMAGFYRAKADAFLLDGERDARMLARLSKILTPTLAFGKSPLQPVEQLAGLLETASRLRTGVETTGE